MNTNFDSKRSDESIRTVFLRSATTTNMAGDSFQLGQHHTSDDHRKSKPCFPGRNFFQEQKAHRDGDEDFQAFGGDQDEAQLARRFEAEADAIADA